MSAIFESPQHSKGYSNLKVKECEEGVEFFTRAEILPKSKLTQPFYFRPERGKALKYYRDKKVKT